ncbi:MAG: hypothetical protein AB3N28_08250, partial [Kordiimonas sp.]
MLKLSIKWGAVSGGIMTVLMLLSFFLYPEPSAETYAIAEMFGYAAIFASLAVIYVAFHEQRVLGAQPETMWRRISLGTGISIVAG